MTAALIVSGSDSPIVRLTADMVTNATVVLVGSAEQGICRVTARNLRKSQNMKTRDNQWCRRHDSGHRRQRLDPSAPAGNVRDCPGWRDGATAHGSPDLIRKRSELTPRRLPRSASRASSTSLMAAP